ncbi:hypothetical protein [Salininema proteolyticum]|uniref:Uncharacterized protein n=1 Tax=Salininema proteolyticum TaxID=1607685 RepID=A0ABV8TXA1_9ACTN
MTHIDARRIAEAASDAPFAFIGMDGHEYEIPNVNTVANRDAERIQQGDEDTLRRIIGRPAYEALKDMTMGVSKQIMVAWFEHGGESGKEGSPSGATHGAGRPSAPTSPRAASRQRKRTRHR